MQARSPEFDDAVRGVGSTDIGDHVSRTEPDPTPDEITDPEHPDYVEPFPGATRLPESAPGTSS